MESKGVEGVEGGAEALDERRKAHGLGPAEGEGDDALARKEAEVEHHGVSPGTKQLVGGVTRFRALDGAGTACKADVPEHVLPGVAHDELRRVERKLLAWIIEMRARTWV